MPAIISQFTLPVRNATTGEIENQTFNLPGSSTPEGNGFGYGTCSTAYITTAKEATLSNFVLKTNGIVSITFTNAVPSNATLNVNSTGAKAIHHRGAAIANNIIFGGDTVTFIYDGTYFNLIAIDRLPTVSNDTATF